MVLRTSTSTGYLLLHAVEPSAINLICYLLIAFGIVGAHVLSLSISGVAFPNSTNDTFMLFYANNIIRPLASISYSVTLNTGLVIALWGAGGLMVYAIILFLLRTFSQWNETEHDVTMPQQGLIIPHPLQHTALVRAAWRLGLSVVGIGVTIIVLQVIRWCLANDEQLLHATNGSQATFTGLKTMAVWVIIFHVYLVLLRLYLFRTRLFGEFLY